MVEEEFIRAPPQPERCEHGAEFRRTRVSAHWLAKISPKVRQQHSISSSVDVGLHATFRPSGTVCVQEEPLWRRSGLPCECVCVCVCFPLIRLINQVTVLLDQ